MKSPLLFLTVCCLACQPTQSQTNEPPSCDECVFDETPKTVSWRVTIPSDTVRGQRIRISGTIFQSDGKTPAAGVLLYAYHTNATGRYAKRGTEDRRSHAWWHGYLRGWLKADERGRYEIATIRPAPYPGRDIPAHIHALVKAPEAAKVQWISDFVFQGDPLLTESYWYRTELSEGLLRYEGVALKPSANGILTGTRDIVLHPAFDADGKNSGLLVGTSCPAFDPSHVWGADRGTRACPMCKYGHRTSGVMAWLGDDNWANAAQLAVFLEKQLQQRGTNGFKAFLIYTNPKRRPKAEVETMLTDFARKTNLKNVAVMHVSSPDEKRSSFLYGINPRSQNTVFVYDKRVVVGKVVNLEATPEKLEGLLTALEK